ncbi:DUF2892 domain-containing protein [Limibaculum sp. M0105]|uniref:DUF2892 domain-containing protein n=1 Tax=Thermohalobaculum xanthum TaxID=2753746 RepID=A0A8J7SBX2_9RHOB|nr:DUF2892 domain-containing protein [Thermohalobaculum xanthum]MBK0398458.1 DUF2892 domain-containing protein [Thermohalobaculum xanthum]
MKFDTNIGTTDRILRIVLGLLLIGMAIGGQIGPWGWIGIVPVLTAFIRYCPAYAILGIRTCKEC